jgi:hypothetical protein
MVTILKLTAVVAYPHGTLVSAMDNLVAINVAMETIGVLAKP